MIPVIYGLLTIACYYLTRRLHVDMRTSVVLALGTSTGTFLVVYSKIFSSEPLTTLCLVLAIERAVAIAPTTSGIATAAAALTRPQVFALTPLLLWRLKTDGGWPALVKCTIPILVGLLLAISYNVVRFGDPFNFGYSNPQFPQGFTTPFYEGAGGLLFHPEKSVFIFAPIVVLIPFGLKCLWSRHRTAFWLLSGNLVLTFTMAATWWAWGGGWTWGPRLLIPGLVPAVAAVGLWRQEGSRRAALTVLALFVLGAVVNIPAMLIGTGAQLADHPRPQFGPHPFRQLQLATAAVLSPIDAFRGAEFPLWQVKALRMLDGTAGALLITGISVGLVVAAAFAFYQIHRNVRSATERDWRQPA